ncbi:uncharacterized protein LOC114355240 isoform X1 [Ostrinia furnacalis]|uniref:uncharacterized protein LOC114355240 isoform X1 n=1 Tax=Ostrinia furnacalis TaxID=93504 RepID=UPI001040ACB9|nr:uncharacterized protein LOC114355240 isoform X1 [Ostrinia furnacalis]
MSLSDSMFLFEIVVEEIKSLINCQEFNITSQFADLFSLNLKDPNELAVAVPKRNRKKVKRKSKVRDSKIKVIKAPAPSVEPKIKIGQSILIANNVDSLKMNMQTYPLQLTLWSKDDPQLVMGSTSIPWSTPYIAYLNDIIKNRDVTPVTVEGTYNVFDELSSRRMATIQMSIKLSCLKDKVTTQFRSLSEDDPQTFMYTGFNSKPTTILSTIKDKQVAKKDNALQVDNADPGTIKTIYSGGKRKYKRSSKDKNKSSKATTKTMHSATIQPKKLKTNLNRSTETAEPEPPPERVEPSVKEPDQSITQIKEKIVDLVKSDTDLEVEKPVALIKSKSYASLEYENHLNTLDYIFGDRRGPFGNQVYCVGYFTVQKDTPSKQSIKDTKSSDKSEEVKEKFKFRLCDSECPSKKATSGSRSLSHCSIDLPQEAANLISVTKCDHVECDVKKHRELPPPPDDRILIDMSGLKGECCNVTEKIEEVVGGMTAKMKVGNDPCYCSCECTFGFTKKTTYCKICGGYELSGDELSRRPGHDMPFPCPIFHKLVDKKFKSFSASGSDSRRNLKGGKKSVVDKSGESEKDGKKGKKKKKDDRFKFNYGYQGIPPQIGHSQCAMPCTGTLGNVPKHMGWLWTAEDVPGMKFRPNWKPGATNKFVVRLLRMAKNPGEVIAKKRKKDQGKKRPLKRPLLIVHKKEGEYTVTMETMKAYSKPRALNQHPYEDKPVVTYTIGRSDEENRERRLKKERAQRRLERAQRDFIQSAFKDMCQDICLKTYQQALGILPDTEDPECTCYPAEPGPDRTNLDVSCSCSEDSASLGSDTDSDEWIVEFTPPNALFDPTYKGKKVLKVDNGTQYTYLDYRVKLTDRFGNPVPRFFKGPDGKQQCSDLGGFWSPDRKWLEINVDGYIAPDNRWAPNSFIGPSGEQVDAETGKFQATNLKWLVVGIDGYVDGQGKWKFYPKPRASPPQKQPRTPGKKGGKKGDDKKKQPEIKPSVATWSCFGDASPKDLGKMGIMGHGLDRKLLLSTLQQMLARGEDVTIPQPSVVPRRPESKRGRKPRAHRGEAYDPWNYFAERTKCRHPVPSEKGIVAVDAHGNKTYFRLKNYRNKRPKDRLADLNKQGISLSSFHLPCFHSFINSEIMKQQQRERFNALAARGKSVATQAN